MRQDFSPVTAGQIRVMEGQVLIVIGTFGVKING